MRRRYEREDLESDNGRRCADPCFEGGPPTKHASFLATTKGDGEADHKEALARACENFLHTECGSACAAHPQMHHDITATCKESLGHLGARVSQVVDGLHGGGRVVQRCLCHLHVAEFGLEPPLICHQLKPARSYCALDFRQLSYELLVGWMLQGTRLRPQAGASMFYQLEGVAEIVSQHPDLIH